MICSKDNCSKIVKAKGLCVNHYRKMERVRIAKEKEENENLRKVKVHIIRRTKPVRYRKCTGEKCANMIPAKDLWCYECECKELNVSPQINLNYMGEQ